MGKSPWDEDSDVPAFARSRSGSTRWGRVFLGVAFVIVATFVGAYYLPLFRAHDTLSAEHRRVSEQNQTLQRSLNEAQAELKTAKARRDELEAEQHQREATKTGQSSELETVRSELKSKLDRYLKKGSELGSRDGHLVLAIPDALVFSAGKLEVSNTGKQLLCDFAKASGRKPLNVLALDASDSVAPAFAAKFPSVLALRAARAAAVAETLQAKCEVDAGALRIQLPLAAPAATLEGAKLAPVRIELELGSKSAP
jgi:chemotaxis protein MotB